MHNVKSRSNTHWQHLEIMSGALASSVWYLIRLFNKSETSSKDGTLRLRIERPDCLVCFECSVWRVESKVKRVLDSVSFLIAKSKRYSGIHIPTIDLQTNGSISLRRTRLINYLGLQIRTFLKTFQQWHNRVLYHERRTFPS